MLGKCRGVGEVRVCCGCVTVVGEVTILRRCQCVGGGGTHYVGVFINVSGWFHCVGEVSEF